MNPRDRQSRVDELFTAVCAEDPKDREKLLRRLRRSETPSVLVELNQLLAADEALAENTDFFSQAPLARLLRASANKSPLRAREVSAVESCSDSAILLLAAALEQKWLRPESLSALLAEWYQDDPAPSIDSLVSLVCKQVGRSGDDLLETVLQLLSSHSSSIRQTVMSLSSFPLLAEALKPSNARRGSGDSNLQRSQGTRGTTWLDVPETTDELPVSHFGVETNGSRFVVQRPLASGGLGRVSVAIDRELDREVALKEMREDLIDHPGCRLRFLREATITGGLEHPGIVPVYACGMRPDGRPFYAMRLVEGQNLKEAIAQLHENVQGSVEFETKLRRLLTRFYDVCQAMAYAHQQGVLHRDLKPSNIMLGEHGETLIVDWGLALRFRTSDDAVVPSSHDDVREGEAVSENSNPSVQGGTPFYSSPEQLLGKSSLDERSDIYSLGVTLYVILTCQTPFETLSDALADRKQRKISRPTQVNRHVPKALEAICLRAMSFKPADRYPDCRELGNDIEHWLAGEPVQAWPEPWNVSMWRWAHRHITWVASSTAFLVAIVAALLVTMFLINKERSELAAVNRELDAQRRRVDNTNDFLRNQVDETARLARVSRRTPSLQLIQRSIEFDRDALSPENIFQLRDWAIHALAKSDLKVERHRDLPTIVGRDDATADSTKWRVAFSPSLDLYAVAMETGQVEVFREADDVLLATLFCGVPINGVLQFSPDGRYLALKYSSDAKVRVWNWKKQELVLVTDDVVSNSAFAFHPSSEQFIVGRQQELKRYSLATRQMLQRIEFGYVPLNLAYSPAGHRVAVTSNSQPAMTMVNLNSEKKLSIMSHADAAFCVAWHPEERFLASACADQNIYLWDAKNLKLVDVLPVSALPVQVNFNHEGDFIAVTLRDGTLELWDVSKKELTATAGGISGFWHPEAVDPPRFSFDNTRLSYGYDGRTLTTWSVASSVVKRLSGTPGGLRSGQVMLHTQTGTILTASDDAVRLWDPVRRQEIGRLTYPNLKAIALSSDGQQLYACTNRGMTVRDLSWEQNSDRFEFTATRPTALRENVPVFAVAASPDGKYAFAAFKDRLSRVELANQQWHHLVSRDSIRSLAIHPVAPLIAFGSNEPGSTEIWNYERSQRVIDLQESGGTRVAFSPDGRFLAVNSRNRCSIYVEPHWHLAHSFPRKETLAFGTGSVAFTPDSRFLIFAESRHRLSVIDLETGRENLGLENANRNSGVACCFDATSTRLIVNTGRGAQLDMWDLNKLQKELSAIGLPPGAWLDQLPKSESSYQPEVAYINKEKAKRWDSHVQEAVSAGQWQAAADILRIQQEQDVGDLTSNIQLAIALNHLKADDDYRELRAQMLVRFEYLEFSHDILNLLMACLITDIDGVNHLPIDRLLRRTERIPPRYWATPQFQLLHGLAAYRRGELEDARRMCEFVLAVQPEKQPLRFLTAEILQTLVQLAGGKKQITRDRLIALGAKLEELRASFLWTECLVAESLLREANAILEASRAVELRRSSRAKVAAPSQSVSG